MFIKMKKIKIDKNFIQGYVSLEYGDDWIKPWRIEVSKKNFYPSPDNKFLVHAEKPVGARLRFYTNSSRLILNVRPSNMLVQYDLIRENQYIETQELETGKKQVLFENLKEGIYDIWLSQNSPVELKNIEIEDDSEISVPLDKRIKWVTYGSSITHCEDAYSPSKTWPSITARNHNLNLTCLGYSGQCQLDGQIAKIIRDLDTHIITLKLSANVYGKSTLSERTFPNIVIDFIDTIREKHKTTPIGIITPIIRPGGESSPNKLGLTQNDYRKMIYKSYQSLLEYGDKNLYFFNGKDIFGRQNINLLHDGGHPNGEGYELMGKRISNLILPVLLKNCGL